MIDILFVSKGDTKDFILMTQKAIDTAIANTKIKLNCVVLEQIKGIKYKNAKTVNYPFKFNYNRVLNYGVSITQNPYVLLANNDLIFHKNWAENLINNLGEHYSASPYSEYNPHGNIAKSGVYPGYVIGKQIMGWCIFVKREIFNIIGKLDESYTFWASDQIYSIQLQKANLQHLFIAESRVDHVCSQTLETSENKDIFMMPQSLKFRNDMKYKYEFTVIMASFLGKYKGCASKREEKFIRAVKSVLNQSYKNFELIIVADGCDKTVELYQSNFSEFENVKCLKIAKQELFSGNVRYAGQLHSEGKYTCYCDSDDYLLENHLQLIKDNIHSLDWAYMSEYALTNEGLIERDVKLALSSAGTSSIVHRSNMQSNWSGCNGHCHDWKLIEKLKAESENYEHIGRCGYVVCHTPSSFDN